LAAFKLLMALPTLIDRTASARVENAQGWLSDLQAGDYTLTTNILYRIVV